MDEFKVIVKDSETLGELAKGALEKGTLETTETLEQLSALSQRLLCRNRAREAFAKYGAALQGKADPAIEAAAATLVPAYFRHTPGNSSDEDGQTDLWVSKVFLHEVTMVPPYALLIFGGELEVQYEEGRIVVDGWAKFEAPARIGVLVRELRSRVDEALGVKLANPDGGDLGSDKLSEALCSLLDSDGF